MPRMLIIHPGRLMGIGRNGEVVDVSDEVALYLLEEGLGIEVSEEVISAPAPAPEPADEDADDE